MNKPLFWTGVIFQSIHFLAWLVLGTFLIWQLITLKDIIIAVYLIFNLVTLLMIFIGAISNK